MTVNKPSAPAAAMRAAEDQKLYQELYNNYMIAAQRKTPLNQDAVQQAMLEKQYAMAIAAAEINVNSAVLDPDEPKVGDKFYWALFLAKSEFPIVKWRINYFGKDNTSCSLIGGDNHEPILLANEASAVGQAWDANDLNDEMRKAWLMSEIQARIPKLTPEEVVKVRDQAKAQVAPIAWPKIKPGAIQQAVSPPMKGGAGFRGLADLLDKNDRQEITKKSPRNY